MLRACERNIQPLVIIHEADGLPGIGSHEGEDDNVLLSPLVSVHGVHFDSRQSSVLRDVLSKLLHLSCIECDDSDICWRNSKSTAQESAYFHTKLYLVPKLARVNVKCQ